MRISHGTLKKGDLLAVAAPLALRKRAAGFLDADRENDAVSHTPEQFPPTKRAKKASSSVAARHEDDKVIGPKSSASSGTKRSKAIRGKGEPKDDYNTEIDKRNDSVDLENNLSQRDATGTNENRSKHDNDAKTEKARPRTDSQHRRSREDSKMEHAPSTKLLDEPSDLTTRRNVKAADSRRSSRSEKAQGDRLRTQISLQYRIETATRKTAVIDQLTKMIKLPHS